MTEPPPSGVVTRANGFVGAHTCAALPELEEGLRG